MNAPTYARLKPNYRFGIVKEGPKKEAKKPSALKEPEGETKPKAPEKTTAKAEPKKQTFGQAFAAARRAGKATFMWDGRKFTTQTKEEKRAADTKRVRDVNRAELTNRGGSFKRGNSIPTSFGPQAKAKTPAAPARAAPVAEAAPKRMKTRQDKPSGTSTPAKVSVPKVAKKVKKYFSPKSR
jgi:hypothetical protein